MLQKSDQKSGFQCKLPLFFSGFPASLLQCSRMQALVCTIREQSWLARIAAKKLNARKVALVVGRRIHLHGISAAAFLQDKAWVRHELCHVRQYQQYTIPGFLFLYLLETIRRGYYRNRFEVEARAAEKVPVIPESAVEFRPVIRP